MLVWIKANKLATAIIAVLSFFVFVVLFSWVIGYNDDGYYENYPEEASFYEYDSYPAYDSYMPSLAPLEFGGTREKTVSSGGVQLEIKEGNVEVKSEDAENDFEILKNIVSEKGGYVETSKKNESNVLLEITAQVRMPAEDFEDFVKEVEASFEVEDFELSNYKMDIQRELDEVDIIKRALEDLDFLREETLKLENGEERINLLSRITTEMQFLASQQRDFERNLGGKELQSDLATVTFVFRQTLRADLWPEDLGNLFHDRINWALDSIATILISVVANSFVLLFKIVEYILYVGVIALPVSLVWKLVVKIKRGRERN